jgi:WD40 repeat protein
VYYQDVAGVHVSRVPLNGSGKTETMFSPPVGNIFVGAGLGMSPDGKLVATAIASMGVPRVALFEVGSPNSPRVLAANHYVPANQLQFTPDGKSLAYVSRENGVDNVWVQPLDGSTGHSMTDFNSEQIWAFSLSSDGKRLAILRGHLDSDVVLLQESKQ